MIACASHCSPLIIEYLVDMGADVAVDNNGHSATFIALLCCPKQVNKYLEDKGRKHNWREWIYPCKYPRLLAVGEIEA